MHVPILNAQAYSTLFRGVNRVHIDNSNNMKCTSNTQMHFMITSIPVFQNIHELQHLKG